MKEIVNGGDFDWKLWHGSETSKKQT